MFERNVTKKYRKILHRTWRHAWENVRRHGYRYAQRFVFLCFIGVALWVVLVWYRLFHNDILTQDEKVLLQKEYAGVVFDQRTFDVVVSREKARRESFSRGEVAIQRDIFFPEDYTPQETRR